MAPSGFPLLLGRRRGLGKLQRYEHLLELGLRWDGSGKVWRRWVYSSFKGEASLYSIGEGTSRRMQGSSEMGLQ